METIGRVPLESCGVLRPFPEAQHGVWTASASVALSSPCPQHYSLVLRKNTMF